VRGPIADVLFARDRLKKRSVVDESASRLRHRRLGGFAEFRCFASKTELSRAAKAWNVDRPSEKSPSAEE